MSLNLNDSKAISIHAPARGATDFPRHSCRRSHAISIHAPARGATCRQTQRRRSSGYFNPRSREGSDRIFRTFSNSFFVFQSTLPRGERHSPFRIFSISLLISIHAPARGATRRISRISSQNLNFNPRSREGSDGPHYRDDVYEAVISIHAPARGATWRDCGSDRSMEISIHAPARGATAMIWSISLIRRKFQSTLPRGERRWTFFAFYMEIGISIHAPARGATSILSKIHPMFLTISHNASSFSSFPFHSFLPHLLNSSTFCALFQVRISRAFSVYYRFAPKKSTPDLQLYHVLHRYVQL